MKSQKFMEIQSVNVLLSKLRIRHFMTRIVWLVISLDEGSSTMRENGGWNFRTPSGKENESDGMVISSSSMQEVSPEMLNSDLLFSLP